MSDTIGILGGGQLGKMLYLAGANLALDMHLMDSMSDGPAAKICKQYHIGDFMDYDQVMKFGRDMNVVTIEIEKINVDALKDLESEGVKIYPQPHLIAMIQDKGLQKKFYEHNKLASSRFKNYKTIEDFKIDLSKGEWTLPVVQKIRKGGYDGRGVNILKTDSDFNTAFQADFLIEEKVAIDKEIAVITCSDPSGNIIAYDPVEMVFDPVNNILKYQIEPADINAEQVTAAKDLAVSLSKKLGIVGLLAIEMFLDQDGEILINEVAPRPHNSGHHTIEASQCSQYENHLRAISGLALGDPATMTPSILINLLGEEGHVGPVVYEGLNEILSISGVHVHIYGKAETKPNRKMGHITITDSNIDRLKEKYETVVKTIKAVTKS